MFIIRTHEYLYTLSSEELKNVNENQQNKHLTLANEIIILLEKYTNVLIDHKCDTQSHHNHITIKMKDM